jgi:hypothetical protein
VQAGAGIQIFELKQQLGYRHPREHGDPV